MNVIKPLISIHILIHVIILELYIKYAMHGREDDDVCNNLNRVYALLELGLLHDQRSISENNAAPPS